MADQIFKVGALSSVLKRVEKMPQRQRKKYDNAIDLLLTHTVVQLRKRGRIIDLNNGAYLLTVGLNGRVLFTEREDVRIVIEAGDKNDVLRRVSQKAAEMAQRNTKE